MAKDVDQVSAVQKVHNTLYQADKGYENRLNYPVNSDMRSEVPDFFDFCPSQHIMINDEAESNSIALEIVYSPQLDIKVVIL